MNQSTLSFYTCTVSSQGPRPYMEDTSVIRTVGKGKALLGVFDGHGGDEVAKLCAQRAPELMEAILVNELDISIAIRKLYDSLDNICKEHNFEHVGACAAIAIITKDRIWFSNCGDTMIACKFDNKVHNMSVEHKVLNESARLKETGAIITNFDCPRIFGGLNIARTIGDNAYKPHVTHIPYISSVNLKTSNVEWVSIASDGIWDVMDCEEYGTLLDSAMHMATKPAKAVATIMTQAYRRGSTDNCTIIHCSLKPKASEP